MSTSLSNTIKLSQNIGKLLTKNGMERVMQKVLWLNRQVQVNEKGIDNEGQKFPPYSQIHQERRRKGGKLPANKVDLKWTGDMLRSLGVKKVTNKSGVIGFSAVDEKRKALGVMRNKKRPINFIGLTDESIKELLKYINSMLGRK